MRLFFLLARRVPPVPSPVLDEAFRILRRRGLSVSAAIDEEIVVEPERWRPDHDLYVLKSHTQLALSLAGVLEAKGARLLHPYRACVDTQNKIVAHERLSAAGIPVPRAWVAGEAALLKDALARSPLVIKPYLGHRGVGVRRVDSLGELRGLDITEAPVLVQEFVPGDGQDLKVYVIGHEVFAVRKRFSSTSFTRPGVPCPVDAEIEAIALACGRALGLSLYGLDVLRGPDGPMVVDVNHFPGYKGVPGAGPLIARHIEERARGAVAPALAAVAGGTP